MSGCGWHKNDPAFNTPPTKFVSDLERERDKALADARKVKAELTGAQRRAIETRKIGEVAGRKAVEADARDAEERAVGAEVLAQDYCESKEQASVDLREFGAHKPGCSNYRASRDCDCGFHSALRRNP